MYGFEGIYRCRLAAVAIAAMVLLAGANMPCAAQDQGLTVAPIDEKAPDVVTFRSRSSESPSDVLEFAIGEGLPADQFFASINPSSEVVFGESSVPENLVNERCPLQLVDWDRTNLRGWFTQNYGAPCDLTLHCNWIEDSASRASKSIIAEQQLEAEASQAEDTGTVAEHDVEIFDPADEHMTGFPDVTIKVTLAGNRDCALTHYCSGPADSRCNEAYLRARASQIVIDQLGN